MDLQLKTDNNLSKTLKEKLGVDGFNEMKEEKMKISNYTCQCCGWEGGKEIENRKHLTLFVDSLNEENVKESKTSLCCRSCYLINNVDVAIKGGYVKFVNSQFSQGDLIKISWSDSSAGVINNKQNRQRAIDDKAVVLLKKDAEEYLEKIKNSTASSQLKVIFTDKFITS